MQGFSHPFFKGKALGTRLSVDGEFLEACNSCVSQKKKFLSTEKHQAMLSLVSNKQKKREKAMEKDEHFHQFMNNHWEHTQLMKIFLKSWSRGCQK